MSLEIMVQILGMQNYSIQNIEIQPDKINLWLEKREHSYCCPTCKQYTFSGYDLSRRTIEDLPMSDRRLFINLPVYRLYCSTCQKDLELLMQ